MWTVMVRAFEDGAKSFATVANSLRGERERHLARIHAQRSRLVSSSVDVDVPKAIRAEMQRAIREMLSSIEREHARLLDAMEQILEDFEHAEENEDRFVILAFGEVNAGKTALANHVAGFDFDGVPAGVRAKAFVGDGEVARLEELETECTREYQGFRLPGMLWIDCPGVLSTRFANADLARRLVSRADFLMFVSSSDAPFKATEMEELARLVELSGNRHLEGWLVVTKMDIVEEDEDDAGEIRRRIEPKPERDRAKQQAWAAEQVRRTRLARVVRFAEPLAVTVYVGRDRLGRSWRSGEARRAPAMGWDRQYVASGMPTLFRLLTQLVQSEGPALKVEWPRKRASALRRALQGASDRLLDRIDALLAEVVRQRQAFSRAMVEAEDAAAELARERVRPCLGGNGIFRQGCFDRAAAARDLQAHLRQQVARVVERRTREAFERVDHEIRSALLELAAQTSFELDLQPRTRTKTYQSTVKAEAVGRGLGGAGGAVAGGALGSAILPFIGTLIGGVIGGFLGGAAGEYVGGKVYEETVTIVVPAGTNANDVIRATEDLMASRASEAVTQLHRTLDRAVLGHLEGEVKRVRDAVREWKSF